MTAQARRQEHRKSDRMLARLMRSQRKPLSVSAYSRMRRRMLEAQA